MADVIQLRPPLYEATPFRANTVYGEFRASGTICGSIDFIGPFDGCYSMTPDECLSLIVALQRSRADVLQNSNPFHDPRITA